MIKRGLIVLILALGGLTGGGAAQTFTEIDDAVFEGMDRGVYPGAVVVIGRKDSILYSRGYGRFTWSRSSPVPSPDSTYWDIASITKVMGTASAVMRLVGTARPLWAASSPAA